MSERTCLVISAHPDDMEIGMGGTVAKMVKAGCSLISVVLTDGHRGPNTEGLAPDQLAESRKLEAQEAAAILGVQQVLFAGLPNLVDDSNYRRAADLLRDWMTTHVATEVFTLHPELDRHPTHRLAGKLTLECAPDTIRNIWAYEVWGLFGTWDRLEDISEHIDTKRSAIEKHRSQVGSVPYSDGVIGLNRWRAVFADPSSTAAMEEYAEVFLKLRGGESC